MRQTYRGTGTCFVLDHVPVHFLFVLNPHLLFLGGSDESIHHVTIVTSRDINGWSLRYKIINTRRIVVHKIINIINKIIKIKKNHKYTIEFAHPFSNMKLPKSAGL